MTSCSQHRIRMDGPSSPRKPGHRPKPHEVVIECRPMRQLALWLTLVVALVLAGAGSSEEKAGAGLAEGCLLNTDCASPLVCAFRRCHVACASSRDCAAGQRCVTSDRPTHVCQLADESNCTFTSDC